MLKNEWSASQGATISCVKIDEEQMWTVGLVFCAGEGSDILDDNHSRFSSHHPKNLQVQEAEI